MLEGTPVVQDCRAVDALHAVFTRAESSPAESICLINNMHLQGHCHALHDLCARKGAMHVKIKTRRVSSRVSSRNEESDISLPRIAGTPSSPF